MPSTWPRSVTQASPGWTNRAAHTGLAMESFSHIVLGDDPRMGDLQGDLVIECEIEGDKDLTHTPAAQQFQQTIPGAEILREWAVGIWDHAGDEIAQRLTFIGNSVHGRTNGRWGKNVAGWLLLVLRPIGRMTCAGPRWRVLGFVHEIRSQPQRPMAEPKHRRWVRVRTVSGCLHNAKDILRRRMARLNRAVYRGRGPGNDIPDLKLAELLEALRSDQAWAAVAVLEPAADLVVSSSADAWKVWLGQSFEARAEVYGRADCGVVHQVVGAEIA